MAGDLEWMQAEGMRIKAVSENYPRMTEAERARLDPLLTYYRSASFAIDLSRRVHELAKRYGTLSRWTHESMASYLSDMDPWSGWYLDLVVSREEAKLALQRHRPDAYQPRPLGA
jgi:hypothetical protein